MSSPEPHPRLKLPTFLVVIAMAVIVLGGTMAIAGAVSGGISADEPSQIKRTNKFRSSGLYATPKEVRLAQGAIPARAYVYGPATALIQHRVNVFAGNESSRDEISRTQDAYVVRHLVVAVIGIAGVVAVGATAWLLLGDWRWGVLGAAVLAAIPMWTGHSMFNPKDVSVATGHSFATLGLIALAAPWTRRRGLCLAVSALTLTAGVSLMVGTRPAMWTSLAASLVLFAAILTWSRAWTKGVAAGLLGALAAAYALLWGMYPRVFGHPLTMLWESATASSDFNHETAHSQRAYIFTHTLQEWPLILLGLSLFGTVAALVIGVGRLRVRSSTAVGLFLVGSQAFVLPVVAVIQDSTLYNGLRQLLFAVPAQAALAAFGLAVIFAGVESRWARASVAVVAALGLVLPTAVQASMFPYQYAYINVAAEQAGVAPDADYWNTSFREYLPEVATDIKLVCPPRDTEKSFRRSREDCRTRKAGTFAAFWKASGKPSWDVPERNEFYAILRAGRYAPYDECKVVHRVTRRANLKQVTISRMYLCHLPNTGENRAPERSGVNPWDATPTPAPTPAPTS
jgi:hypothetical protein